MILYDGPLTREHVLSLFDAVGVQPDIRLRVRSFELVRGLIARGHGYTVHSAVPQTSTTYDGGQVVVKPIRTKSCIPKSSASRLDRISCAQR